MRRDESEETLRLSEALRRGPEELVDRSDATCAKPFLKKKGRSLTSWVKQRSLTNMCVSLADDDSSTCEPRAAPSASDLQDITIHDLLRCEVMVRPGGDCAYSSVADEQLCALSRSFARFVEERFAKELVAFYLSVERFRRVAASRACECAREIVHAHVREGAALEVNVGAAARNAVLSHVTSCRRPASHVFDEMQTEVTHILSVNFLVPFLKRYLKNQHRAENMMISSPIFASRALGTATARPRRLSAESLHSQEREEQLELKNTFRKRKMVRDLLAYVARAHVLTRAASYPADRASRSVSHGRSPVFLKPRASAPLVSTPNSEESVASALSLTFGDGSNGSLTESRATFATFDSFERTRRHERDTSAGDAAPFRTRGELCKRAQPYGPKHRSLLHAVNALEWRRRRGLGSKQLAWRRRWFHLDVRGGELHYFIDAGEQKRRGYFRLTPQTRVSDEKFAQEATARDRESRTHSPRGSTGAWLSSSHSPTHSTSLCCFEVTFGDETQRSATPLVLRAPSHAQKLEWVKSLRYAVELLATRHAHRQHVGTAAGSSSSTGCCPTRTGTGTAFPSNLEEVLSGGGGSTAQGTALPSFQNNNGLSRCSFARAGSDVSSLSSNGTASTPRSSPSHARLSARFALWPSSSSSSRKYRKSESDLSKFGRNHRESCTLDDLTAPRESAELRQSSTTTQRQSSQHSQAARRASSGEHVRPPSSASTPVISALRKLVCTAAHDGEALELRDAIANALGDYEHVLCQDEGADTEGLATLPRSDEEQLLDAALAQNDYEAIGNAIAVAMSTHLETESQLLSSAKERLWLLMHSQQHQDTPQTDRSNSKLTSTFTRATEHSNAHGLTPHLASSSTEDQATTSSHTTNTTTTTTTTASSAGLLG